MASLLDGVNGFIRMRELGKFAMIEIQLGDEDLARTRFAYSPLWELVASCRVLTDPMSHMLHLPWVAEARAALHDFDLSLLSSLIRPVGYIPDFLLPPPTTPFPTIDAEIERVKASDPEIVRREIGWIIQESPSSLALLQPYQATPAETLERLTALLHCYWQRTLQHHWRQLFNMLEVDVLHRSNTLAFYGPEEVFKDLHPAVSYKEHVLYVAKPNDELVRPGGRGVLLIPLIFAWPDLYVTADPPWQPTIAYSPRGIGNLWINERVKPSEALSELIGHGRALVLEQLSVSRTTTDLARLLMMTPGAISQHLARLRQVGVVESLRIGPRVYHRLTAAGETLLQIFPRSR